MTKKLYIKWDEFHNHAKELCEKIKQSGEYNKIVAISRGGLIPAGILAYELDIRNSQAINISSYDEDKQRADEDIEIFGNVGEVDEKTLIVDDLSDTGKTFRILRKIYPQAKYVAVYAKEKGRSVVDIYARSMPDEWIVFPWD
ncbi:MAG: xanthine phosphoribosyltransferase [Alphaproteobacteria bacterium]|nr:xanthine phosphoribosyltransferase [Alphaproteobacteria bacterium]